MKSNLVTGFAEDIMGATFEGFVYYDSERPDVLVLETSEAVGDDYEKDNVLKLIRRQKDGNFHVIKLAGFMPTEDFKLKSISFNPDVDEAVVCGDYFDGDECRDKGSKLFFSVLWKMDGTVVQREW